MTEFDAVDVIRAKRDGRALSDGEIDWVVAAYTDGRVADEQMSALLMAIYLNGMEDREISRWTEAMIRSGERMVLDVDRPTTDKHSTGGVGDKITLPLAPLVAAKGSVTIDGVSLTVNEVRDEHAATRIALNIIPHTQAVTTLGALRPGQSVNVEIDVLARYLQRMEHYRGQH